MQVCRRGENEASSGVKPYQSGARFVVKRIFIDASLYATSTRRFYGLFSFALVISVQPQLEQFKVSLTW